MTDVRKYLRLRPDHASARATNVSFFRCFIRNEWPSKQEYWTCHLPGPLIASDQGTDIQCLHVSAFSHLQLSTHRHICMKLLPESCAKQPMVLALGDVQHKCHCMT
jgi:hypothetical protein